MVALSPVPLWPRDGDVSRLPKDYNVFYDPPSGEYVVYYDGESIEPGSLKPTLLRFGSHALVDPTVTFQVNSAAGGIFRYTYDVVNGSRARQALQKIDALVYSILTPQASHPSWATRFESAKVRDTASPTVVAQTIEWHSKTLAEAIVPGGEVGGFSIESSSLPGFTKMIFRGAPTANEEYSPARFSVLPGNVLDQITKVLKATWDAKTALVIGPRFLKGALQPEIEQNFLFGIQALIREGRLDANSPFVGSAMQLLSA